MPTLDVEPSAPRPQCPSLVCDPSSCLHGSPVGVEMHLTHGVDAAHHVVTEMPLVLFSPSAATQPQENPLPSLDISFGWAQSC